MRQPTVEWQVCGVCNYDCSYCIQSRASRVGQPTHEEVDRFLSFFESLSGRWEVKMTGGEPFASKAFLERIVPGLVERTPHTISVLTNLSAPWSALERFARLTSGRVGIVSTSLHLEFADVSEFVDKARRLRDAVAPGRLVVNEVLVPGRLDAVARAKEAVEAAGLRFFPQVMKERGGVATYDDDETPRLVSLVGRDPTPREANVAPNHKGRVCWTGVDYFVLTQAGDAFSCRTARRFGDGFLGNVHAGTLRLRTGPQRCAWDICPCSVPANRGMIEGVGAGPEDAS